MNELYSIGWRQHRKFNRFDHFCKVLAFMAIGAVFGMMTLALIRHDWNKPQIIAVDITCTACHFDKKPVIKNLAQYRRIKQHKTIAKDQPVLDEIKEHEYLISIITGEKI